MINIAISFKINAKKYKNNLLKNYLDHKLMILNCELINRYKIIFVKEKSKINYDKIAYNVKLNLNEFLINELYYQKKVNFEILKSKNFEFFTYNAKIIYDSNIQAMMN